jgi:hypothetical protein
VKQLLRQRHSLAQFQLPASPLAQGRAPGPGLRPARRRGCKHHPQPPRPAGRPTALREGGRLLRTGWACPQHAPTIITDCCVCIEQQWRSMLVSNDMFLLTWVGAQEIRVELTMTH